MSFAQKGYSYKPNPPSLSQAFNRRLQGDIISRVIAHSFIFMLLRDGMKVFYHGEHEVNRGFQHRSLMKIGF